MSPDFDREVLGAGIGRLTASMGGKPLRFADVIQGWYTEPELVGAWNRALAQLPFAAIAWECPPLTEASVWDRFECVAVDHPGLASASPQPEAFAEHFERATDGVAAFRNLRGDSVLVSPSPAGVFPHLLAFCRTAEPTQQHAFWAAVGQQMEASLGSVPRWLSTAGMGVHWLHVRIDPTPKYYRYRPYRG